MPRGIFSLKQVYEEQVSGTWSTKGDVWISPSPFNAPSTAPYGYWGGGTQPSGPMTSIDRFDFSNDSANSVIKSFFSLGREYHSGTSSESFGYFGGGYNPAVYTQSTVERLNYANDSTTTSPKGPLSQARYYLGATGNINFGYFIGGEPSHSTIDRIDYSNDTATATPKGPLAAGRTSITATGNQNFGWIGGGGPYPAPVSKVERIDYSSDTTNAAPRGDINVPVQGHNAASNSDYGWFVGGYQGSSPTGFRTIVSRIDFSNDNVTASPRGKITAYTYQSPSNATGSSSTGYFAGYDSGQLNVIDYSNDTPNAPVAGGRLYYSPSPGSRYRAAAVSRKDNGLPDTSNISPVATNFGYFGGGETPSGAVN